MHPSKRSNSKWLKQTVLSIVCLMLCVSILFAKSVESTPKLIEYLSQEKMNLSHFIEDAKNLRSPSNQTEYFQYLHKNDSLLALNGAKISSLENFLANQIKVQNDFNQRVKQLQQFSTKTVQSNSQKKIAEIKTLTEANKATIELIKETISLANRYQTVLANYNQTLELWKSKNALQNQLAKLQVQENKLNEALKKLYENGLKLQQDVKITNEFNSAYLLEARTLLNNQIINLTQQKITELNLQRVLARADYLLLKSPDIHTLQKVTDTYKNIISQLSDMEQSLKKILFVLKNELDHVTDAHLKQQFSSLISIINSRVTGIGIQEQTLQEDLENHQQQLKNQLSVRQSLAEYSFSSWPTIVKQFFETPLQMVNYLQSLTLKFVDNYLWQNKWACLLIWVMGIVTASIVISLHLLLKQLTQDKERSRISGHLYDKALILLSRNMKLIGALSVGIVIFYFNGIPFANYRMLFNLCLVWLTFHTLILIARLALMERVSDASGIDVRLYYRLKWLLLIGGTITGLMVFSQQLPMAILLQDIFNRLFMLFLMASSLFAWKSRNVINELLTPYLKTKKSYLRSAVMLLVILTPITLLVTALIGILGYVNLAWTLSRYQLQILFVISAYVVMRGLLFDALELVSEWMVTGVQNGWLWIEVVLKPIDKILRIFLLLFCLYLLLRLFDWPADAQAFNRLYKLGEYPIVNVSGIHITFVSIIEFVILIMVFAWISRWTRELCFRWLYRDASDAGIRNSLSVFTQYAVILIGGFITLRVLGLDFSGMSMILGGLAVGMGFGLRDFASNIVGGLMLLIERPVREGDLITLGNHEGRVAHIGIRSMRVSSWDNMEVLIPNAETFNKPFTNWTHQDSIIRTVFPIKVSRTDDPVMVQQLILDVLNIIPEIVDDPEPQVYLKKIDDALLEFEARYFINVQLHTRFAIRSKVLFAIMAQFQAAGVQPPIPPFTMAGVTEPLDANVPKKITD